MASNSNFDFKDLYQYAQDFELQKILDRKTFQRKIYIDASDAINLLRGIYSVHHKYKFSSDKFRSGRTLVYSMIYKGWFNKVYLLAPHSREFLTKLKMNEILFPETPDNEKKDKFVGELLHEIKLNKLIEKNVNPKQRDIRKHYENYKENAEDLFKAVYLGSDFFWKKRYIHLMRGPEKVVELTNEYFDENTIHDSDLYNILIKVFNEERSNRKKNNHEDAVALCLLNEKLQKYNKNPSQYELPIFYSYSSHILKGVSISAESSKNDKRYFTFQVDEKLHKNVLNTEFFLLDGIFDLEKRKNGDLSFEQFVKTLAYISNVPNHSLSHNNSHKNNVSQKENINRSLDRDETQEIQENKNERTLLEFFRRWIYESGFEEIQHLLTNATKEEIEDSELKNQVNSDIDRLAKQFDIDTKKIELINLLWSKGNDIIRNIKGKYIKDKKFYRDLDIRGEFITRFSYPESFHQPLEKNLRELLVAILEGNGAQIDGMLLNAITNTKRFIFEVINTFAKKPSSEKDQWVKDWEAELYNITYSLSLLWLSGNFETLCTCCEEMKSRYASARQIEEPDQINKLGYPDYRLALVHACAILKCKKYDLQKVNEIFQCIMNKDFFPKNYKVWIGLSFAKYIFWDTQSSVKLPLELQFVQNRDLNKDINKTLKESGLLAKKAIDFIEKKYNANSRTYEQHLRYYYAVNNYIFSFSIVGTDQEFQQLEPKVQILEGIKGGAYWLDRYHDTLANYYAKKSITIADFDDELEEAIKQNELSINKVGELPIYIQLRRELKKLSKGRSNYLATKNLA